MFATQQLLIYPPHLRTAATLPWETLIVNSIRLTRQSHLWMHKTLCPTFVSCINI